MIYREIEIVSEFTETTGAPTVKISVKRWMKRWKFPNIEAAQYFIDCKYTHVEEGMITQDEFDAELKH